MRQSLPPEGRKGCGIAGRIPSEPEQFATRIGLVAMLGACHLWNSRVFYSALSLESIIHQDSSSPFYLCGR
jgi:hypothetical protein